MMKVIQPRSFNPLKTLVVGSVILILIIVHLMRSPLEPDITHWRGLTMGTHYDIKIARPPMSDKEQSTLRQQVDDYLAQVNQWMSTYLPDSEISRFNRFEETVPFPVSSSFTTVTRSALEWAERSGGAFDPTLDPLINLWGFGHQATDKQPPTEEEIAAAQARSGYTKVTVPDDQHLRKRHPEIQLNLNAIAKGYAVDGVATLLQEAGLTNIYIEIGGDMRVHGVNHEGTPWRIGIESPDPHAAPGQRLHGIAHVTEGALAGSGDYRQWIEVEDGGSYSHIIDPRTGRPANHALTAVNVLAGNAMDADAAATALIVMGLTDGLNWIESEEDLEAIFFTRTDNGAVQATTTSGFAERAGYAPLQD